MLLRPRAFNQRAWYVVTAALISACGGPQTTSQQAEEQPATVVAVPAPAPAAQDAGLAIAETADADANEVEGGLTAIGTMWGDSIGEAFGVGGLGLTGTGPSAGGTGEGIGLGSIGTIGHGAGPSPSSSAGGSGYGRIGGYRPPSNATVAQSPPQVVGALDKDVLRRVIMRSRNRFKYCYERQLATNPNLAGKVVTRFVIGPEGNVTTVQDAGSTLTDATVLACVQSAFKSMQFPRPTGGGVVIVTYPLIFQSASPPPDAGADAASDH